MIISRLKLKNWRNFREVDVPLSGRQFVVGANASGKSNLLDVFLFLRDLAAQGGGLQKAVAKRGGLSKILCFGADPKSEVVVDVSFADADTPEESKRRYKIRIEPGSDGCQQPHLVYEKVWNGAGKLVINRPMLDDKSDRARLMQTRLEQDGGNMPFGEVAGYLRKISYLHLVPQFIRSHFNEYPEGILENDPFGRGFLMEIADTPEKIRDDRLMAICEVVKNAVPGFSKLRYFWDADTNTPHLLIGGWGGGDINMQQREEMLSDGTLRLIALLWSLLSNDSLLLLEEPELSLHPGVVGKIPALWHQSGWFAEGENGGQSDRQVLVSTHSTELLSDSSIHPDEVLLLTSDGDGTTAKLATAFPEVSALLDADIPIGEAVVARTRPSDVSLANIPSPS